MNSFNLSQQKIAQLNERHIVANDRWLRMFMGIASEIIKVEDDVIQLQVLYGNPIKESKAQMVAGTWLKAPKNAVLLQAETIEVIEFADRGTPGIVHVLDEGEAPDIATIERMKQQTEQFGESKQFLDRKVFSVEEWFVNGRRASGTRSTAEQLNEITLFSVDEMVR